MGIGVATVANYAVIPITTFMDFRLMQSDKIGLGRFGFRFAGFLASTVGGAILGAEIGGPYGAVGGATIGAALSAAELSYDGIKWFGSQVAQGMVKTENALKNGWYPGGGK